MKIRYDIIYFRFLAIISIVLYHLNDKIIKGGFLGVDILLILTSYLNINSILSSIRKSTFEYVDFIMKKSKRLIPSSLLVLYLCHNYVIDKLEIYSQILFISNYYFCLKKTDYFYQYDNPSPLLHYWCLSLEYQFYFIIPLLLIYLNNNYIIISLILLSLFIFMKYAKKYSSYCYFCFFPRLYQFLFSFFIRVDSQDYKEKKYAIIVTVIHLILSTVSSNKVYNVHLFYSLFIAFVLHKSVININKFHVLSFFSKISYSLYLVHYPIITIIKSNNAIKILLIIVSSILLYKICEEYGYNAISRINNFYIIIAYILLIIYIAVSAVIKESYYHRRIVYSPNKLWADFCVNKLQCKISFQNNCNKALLIGDSHIEQWMTVIYNYFIQYDLIIYFIKITGHEDISSFKIRHIINKVKKITNLELILMCNFRFGIEFKNYIHFINNFNKYYTILQQQILNYTSRIIIINDNPHLLTEAYKCLNKEKANNCYCILGTNCTISDLPVLQNPKITMCNMNKYLCKNNRCYYLIKGKIVYVDKHHLTPYITKYLSSHLIKCIDYKVNNKRHQCSIKNGKCKYYII